jgi:hypothetical protein
VQFLRADDLMYQGKLYLKCWVATLPQDEARCYGIVAAEDLPGELYQPLRRQQVVEVPYHGKLYTEEETILGAWIADL